MILRAAAAPVSGNEYLTVTITPEGLYVYHWNNGAVEEIGALTTTGDYLEPGVEYRVEVLVQSTNKVWIRDWYPATETRPGIQELSITNVFDTTQTGFNNFDWVALGANTDADVEITDVKLERHNSTPFQPVSQFYRYDPLGRRIERTTDDGLGNVETTRYFYDGWRVAEEQDDAENTEATYVYGRYIDEIVTMERNSEDYFYHCDDLYNVLALTDDTGTVVETYEYDDYGMPHITDSTGMSVMKSSVGNPYLFNGRRFDPETGYYYYRTRYLDPYTGRFISRDTIGIWRDRASLGNGYTHVANNPWTMIDPYGLWGCQIFGINFGVGEPNVIFDETWDLTDELGKGLASTIDGVLPIFDPLESVYANEDGSIHWRFEKSRALGAISRDVGLAGAAGFAGRAMSLAGTSGSSLGAISAGKQALSASLGYNTYSMGLGAGVGEIIADGLVGVGIYDFGKNCYILAK